MYYCRAYLRSKNPFIHNKSPYKYRSLHNYHWELWILIVWLIWWDPWFVSIICIRLHLLPFSCQPTPWPSTLLAQLYLLSFLNRTHLIHNPDQQPYRQTGSPPHFQQQVGCWNWLYRRNIFTTVSPIFKCHELCISKRERVSQVNSPGISQITHWLEMSRVKNIHGLRSLWK